MFRNQLRPWPYATSNSVAHDTEFINATLLGVDGQTDGEGREQNVHVLCKSRKFAAEAINLPSADKG